MTKKERLIELLTKGQPPFNPLNRVCIEHLAHYLFINEVGFIPKGRNITENHPVDEFVCSECGFICEDWSEVVYDEDADDRNNREFEFKYCPNCGCKIEDFWEEAEQALKGGDEE